MTISYLHLVPGDMPPPRANRPFKAIIVAELDVDEGWRATVADWLVRNGCLYMVAWGANCSLWDDAVDWAVLEEFDYGEIPDDRFVMTTWHAKEPLSEALWFAGQCAHHPDIELGETVIVHVAMVADELGLKRAYKDSQTLAAD